jgi:excisionase family DNA binding protein
MSEFRAALAEGVGLDALLERMAEKVATRLQNGDQGGSANGEVRPRLLTVEQAAVYVGRSKDAVHHMIASGKLPTVRADRRVFIDMRDLDAWIEEHKQRGLV